MVGIVDYAMGNIRSVANALEFLGAKVLLCKNPEDLKGVERIVLPGVGAFHKCMENLTSKDFPGALDDEVRRLGKPIMGICLGMQAMARRSFEGGEHVGLGWIDADVVRLQPAEQSLRVPHVGWNEIAYRKDFPLFSGLPRFPDFYFVHSYHMKCADAKDVVATCDYGGTVTVSICRDNIFATQFHPEKSQDFGLTLLRNFLAWNP